MQFLFDIAQMEIDEARRIQSDLGELREKLSIGQEETVKASELSRLLEGGFEVLEGGLQVASGEQLYFLLEKGDIWATRLPSGFSFRSDFAIKVRRWSDSDLLTAVNADRSLLMKWKNLQDATSGLWMRIACQMLTGGIGLDSEPQIFAEGDQIIEQGSSGREVFTLIDGRARVVVDGVEVGRVEPGEIFGALAALSEGKRSASIFADEDCTVLKLDETQFLKLIQSRPESFLNLARDLAKNLVSTNKKLVDLISHK